MLCLLCNVLTLLFGSIIDIQHIIAQHITEHTSYKPDSEQYHIQICIFYSNRAPNLCIQGVPKRVCVFF